MFRQIENTPDGYIVSAYLRDKDGNGHFHRLLNFGGKEGDAIEFIDYDVDRFTEAELWRMANNFKIDRIYTRIGSKQYKRIV